MEFCGIPYGDGAKGSRRKDEGAFGADQRKGAGAADLQVIVNGQSSGNRDIALISTFETTEALAAYQNHPDHVAAGTYVRSVTCNRACMDYEF